MKRDDLIKAVSYIQLDEEARARMIQDLEARYGGERAAMGEKVDMSERIAERLQVVAAGKPQKRFSRYTKIAAVVCAIIVAAGVSMPVYALVDSYVKARMEEMPQETVDEIYEQIQEAPVEADSFNREYSSEEKERWKELYAEYQEGRFPEKELLQVGSEEEAEEQESRGEICFWPALSRFYLPLGREMTDEELLEVLDFVAKRDYALMKNSNPEAAEEREALQAEKEKQVQENISKDGITEDEAIELAKERLQELNLDVEGYEQKVFFYKERPGDDFNGGKAFYQVSWYSQEALKYYYFMLDSGSGELLDERIFEEFTRVPGVLD